MKTLLSLGACLAFLPMHALAAEMTAPPSMPMPTLPGTTIGIVAVPIAPPVIGSTHIGLPGTTIVAVPIASPVLSSTLIGSILAPAKEKCACFCETADGKYYLTTTAGSGDLGWDFSFNANSIDSLEAQCTAHEGRTCNGYIANMKTGASGKLTDCEVMAEGA